ncbi:MAG: TetR/AcrR family transcriptional regulator [Gemmatimonadota bacterium]
MPANLKISNDKERNAGRSRESILDAAEELFAEKGYDGTSLNEVGMRAGVSRGTPGYFFGSKSDLYRAVVERCFGEVREAVRVGRVRALASGETPEVILAGVVSDYFDFLLARRNFVRLMEREALMGAAMLKGLPRTNIAGEAVAAISEELGLDPAQGVEAAHLVLSIIGLCWFPAVHASTVVPALGFDPDDPLFRERRKQHVIELVLHGVRDRMPLMTRTQR